MKLTGNPMPTFYRIDPAQRLVLSGATGRLKLPDILDHDERLQKDPAFVPAYSQVVDMLECTGFDFTFDDMRKLGERSVFSKESSIALVVPTDLAFGLGRMFEAFRANQNGQQVRVFRSLDEALRWAKL